MAIGDFTIRKIDKHNTEAGWAENASFIPEQGEFVVYDSDENYGYERFKIGDGVRRIADLPFAVTEAETPSRLVGKNGNLDMINYSAQFGLDHTYSSQDENGSTVLQYQYSPRVDKETGNIIVKTVSDAGTKFHHVYTQNYKPTPEDIGAVNQTQYTVDVNALKEEIRNTETLVNIKKYGAIGDGVHDDTKAFENAIKYNTGIYVPNGVYLLSSPLRFERGNQTFVCDGGLRISGDFSAIQILSNSNKIFVKRISPKSEYTGSGVLIGPYPSCPYYNVVDIDYMDKLDKGFWLSPSEEGKGVACNVFSFKQIDANIGIYFAPGDVKGSYINENTFYGGVLTGKCPLCTEQKGATDPFNGNKFYNVAIEGCSEGMKLGFFQFNHFYGGRMSKWENSYQYAVEMDSDTHSNVFEFTGQTFTNQIKQDGYTEGIGNLFDGRLVYEYSSGQYSDVGRRGCFYRNNMIVENDDSYQTVFLSTDEETAEQDYSTLNYAIEGATYHLVLSGTGMTLTVPPGYGYYNASYFYVLIESANQDVNVFVMHETGRLATLMQPGLYKIECNPAKGWSFYRVDGAVPCDSALSLTSNAPIANRAVAEAIDEVNEQLNVINQNIDKVYIEKRDGTTSIATLYPTGVTSGSDSLTGTLICYKGVQYNFVNGDETTLGRAQLLLGNNIAEGTAGNKEGRLSFYTANGATVGTLTQKDCSKGWLYHQLPDSGGVLINENTCKNYALPLTGGTLSGDLNIGTLETNSGIPIFFKRLTTDGTTTASAKQYLAFNGAYKVELSQNGEIVNSFSITPNYVLIDSLLRLKCDGPIQLGATGSNGTTVHTLFSDHNPPSASQITGLADEMNTVMNTVITGAGGRNLIENSATMTGGAWGSWTDSSSVTMERKLKNDVIYQWSIEASGLTADAWSNVYTRCGSANDPIVRKGEQVNMSVWYYVDSTKAAIDSTVYFELGTYNAQGQYVAGNSIALTTDNLKKDRWTQIALSYTPTSDDECYVNCAFGMRKNGNVAFSMPKLERGKIITDWSLAPEDILRAMA